MYTCVSSLLSLRVILTTLLYRWWEMNKCVWSIPEVHRGKSDTVFLFSPQIPHVRPWEPLYVMTKFKVTWKVLSAVCVNINFLSDVTPCGLVQSYRRFRTTGWLHLHFKVATKLCSKMVSVGSSETSVNNVEYVKVSVNINLHSDHILQDSAPHPLPTTSSRIRTIHQMQ